MGIHGRTARETATQEYSMMILGTETSEDNHKDAHTTQYAPGTMACGTTHYATPTPRATSPLGRRYSAAYGDHDGATNERNAYAVTIATTWMVLHLIQDLNTVECSYQAARSRRITMTRTNMHGTNDTDIHNNTAGASRRSLQLWPIPRPNRTEHLSPHASTPPNEDTQRTGNDKRAQAARAVARRAE